MKHLYGLLSAAAVVLLLLFGSGPVFAQTTVYIAPGGTGGGNSWADAAGSIQDAIESASGSTDIWIKAGTYYVPGDSNFVLRDNVSLYGGFAGTETELGQRTNYRRGGANETILSGDIDKNGITDAANANRVVYGKDITDGTTLDGLTITGGYADASSDDGAGLRLSNGSPDIINCTIFDNWCGDNGSGFYIATTSLPDVTGCYFIKNYAADRGGGAYIASDCNAVFTNCVFANNFAENEGGGVRNYNSAATYINCTFAYNAIPGDVSDDDGTGMQNSGSSPVLINCVFWGNTNNGVAKYDISNSSNTSKIISTNCAFEGTLNGDSIVEVATLDISSTDPMFTNTAGSSGHTGYDAAADWSLMAGSPLIDVGTVTDAPAEDLMGMPRYDPPDIGAFEFTSDFFIATDTTGMGSISPISKWVASGADQAFIITPESGYEITAATYNSADVLPSLVYNGDGSFTYTASSVSEDGLLEVTFEPLATKYVVTASAGAGGAISPLGDTSVTVTDVVVYTITPDADYVVGDLLLNAVSVVSDTVDNGDGTFSYSLTGVGETSTLEVSFLELFTVTVSVGANGSVTPSGSVDVTVNDETEFTFTANTGYILDVCTLGGTDVTGDVVDNLDLTYTYVLTGVDADVTLSVTFKEIVVNVKYIMEGGTGDGSSWANAAGDLQAAIDAGNLGDEIWVAKGIYIVPTDTSFTLKSGVSLYGGFAGTESSKDERSQYRMGETNETKLSADVDGNGFLTGGNAPRVVFGEFISDLTTIDGFTITGGYSDVDGSNGAGMKLRASSPTISNCTFYDFYCEDGTALYLYRSGDDVSSPIVKDCFFIKGKAKDDGGAIYNASGTRAKYINCVFAHNEAADEGGAIRNYECSPEYYNCTFVYNYLPEADPGGGGTYGAAIRNYQTATPYMNTEPIFVNCVFFRNQDGFASRNYDISNTAAIGDAGASVTIINCAVDTFSISSCVATSLVYLKPGGVNVDPGFVDTTGTPGYAGYSLVADWDLVATSILVGKGSTAEADVPTHDIKGEPRGAVVDIGAYEYGTTIGIDPVITKPSGFKLYPNPSEGSFTIEVRDRHITGVQIFDITGRLVERLDDLDHLNNVPLSLYGRTKGMYFLKIMDVEGRVSTEKMIIR